MIWWVVFVSARIAILPRQRNDISLNCGIWFLFNESYLLRSLNSHAHFQHELIVFYRRFAVNAVAVTATPSTRGFLISMPRLHQRALMRWRRCSNIIPIGIYRWNRIVFASLFTLHSHLLLGYFVISTLFSHSHGIDPLFVQGENVVMFLQSARFLMKAYAAAISVSALLCVMLHARDMN